MKYNRTMSLWAGFIGMTVFGVAFLVMGAILPSLKTALNLDNLQAAALVSFQPIGILIGSLVFGPITDRYGYKALLSTALILVIAGLAGLAYSQNLNVLRFTILIIGIGGGILNGATTALVSDASSDSRRSSNLSILGVFYGVGAIVIPLLIGFMKEVPYQHILLGAAIVLCVALVYFLFTGFPAPKVSDAASFVKRLSFLKNPLMILFCFVLFCQSALEGLTQNWCNDYFIGKGVAESQAAIALTAVVVGITVSRIINSILVIKIKPRFALVGSMIILLAGYVCMYMVPSIPSWAATFIVGLGLGPTFPIVCSYVGLMFKEMSGTAFGMALVVALIGNTILNYVRGLVPDAWYPGYMFLVAAVMLVLFICSISLIVKKIEKSSL